MGLVVGLVATSVCGGAAVADPAASDEFTSLVIPVGSSQIAARSIGSGPLVVLIPSLGRPGSDFDPIARRLAGDGFRAVSFDPRGIGQTVTPSQSLVGLTLHDYAADAFGVVEHFGARAHVVGHAFGNRVARTLAGDRPEAVTTVTLLAGGTELPNPRSITGLLKIANPATPEAEFQATVREQFFAPGNDASSWYQGWSRPGMVAQQAATVATPKGQYESGGTAPMLAVQAVQDVIAPPATTEELRSHYPDRVTVAEIDRAGHALVTEQPNAIADAVIPFLRAHPLA